MLPIVFDRLILLGNTNAPDIEMKITDFHRLSRLVFPLILSGLLITGCCADCFLSGDAVDRPPWYDAGRYFPLELENQWIYLINGDPNKLARVSVIDTIQWRGDTLFDMKTYAPDLKNPPEFTHISDLFKTSTDTLFRTTPAYLASYGGIEQSPYVIIRILNPLRVGDSLSVLPASVYGHDPNWGFYNWIIMDNDTAVHTTYGDFDSCLYLQFRLHWLIDQNDYLLAEEFYAPDTGLIRFIEYPYRLSPGDLGDSSISFDLGYVELHSNDPSQ